MRIDIPSHLSDKELLAEVKRLAHCARSATAALIAHLAEVEARSLHLGAGVASMFAYCTEALRLSEGEAFNRIEASRAGRKHPRLLDMLVEGSLNLTTLRLLAPRLTEQNRDELLAEAAGKSKSEVQALLARHAPRPDVPESVRKLPALGGATTPAEAPVTDLPAQLPRQPAAMPPAHRPRPVVTPLAPDRYQITFTGSGETREMLEFAKDMLRHAMPNVDTAEVVNRALRALVEELTRRKFAATERPGAYRGRAQPREGSRHAPASVKRAVWIRDRGRCAFRAGGGHCCNERGFLEFHHLLAFAKGGEATLENIALRCRAHNGYEADLEFGERRPGGEWDTRATGRVLVPERVPGERSLSIPG